MDQAFDVAGLIVVAAIIGIIFGSKEAKGIFNSWGTAFDNSIIAAEGKGKYQTVSS